MTADKSLFYTILATLLFVPLFFGGNMPPVWWGCLGLAGVASIFAAFMPLAAVPKWMKFSALGVMLVFVWGSLQVVPLPDGSAFWDSLAHPMWHQAQAALGREGLWNSISIHPQASSAFLLLALAFPLFFFFGYQSGAGRQGVRYIKVFVALAVMVSGYGLLALLPEHQYVLWKLQPQYLGNVTGTFLNRNSFATFAGMGLLCAGMLTHRHWLSIPHGKHGKKARYVAALAVLVCALLLSSSRAGVACAVAGSLVYIGAALYGETKARAHTGKILALLGAGVVVAFAFAGSTVWERTETVEDDFSMRQAIYENSWDAALQRPLLGHGVGSFEGVYKQYHTLDIPLWKKGRIDHAHNTALEMMVELGIPVTLLLLGVWFLFPLAFIQGILRRKQEGGYGNKTLFPALGLALWAQTTLHSLVDFYLEMQGVSLPLLILFGVCARHCMPVDGKQLKATWRLRHKSWLLVGVLLVGIAGVSGSRSFAKPTYPLAQMPLQTYVWMQRAVKSHKAEDYYMSFLTAPVEPKLFYPRLYYLSYEWPHFTKAEKRLFTPFLQRCVAVEGERIWRRMRKTPYGITMLIEGSLLDALS